MKLLWAILLLSFCNDVFTQESDNWHIDYDEAIDAAKNKGLPVLMNFSGSDWCLPCMRLSQTIFQTDRFRAFSKDSLVLLNLDFPRRKKNMPAKEEMAKRDKLAERYNNRGVFPAVIIIDHKGDVLGKTGFVTLSVDEYIKYIKKIIKGFYLTRSLLKKDLKLSKKIKILMGSKFEIAAIHTNEEFALGVIDSVEKEIIRIEALISSWKDNSQTSLINANAGIAPVVVDRELFSLIKRAKKISVLTEGAFDISFASMDKVWKFDRRITQMPPEEAIRASVAKINYKNIILNEKDNSVYLKEKGMKIGFGAIGKGYAANKARHLMINMGIENGMLNAGGDLIAWGEGMNNEKWKVGIADPKKQTEFISWLEIEDQAIVTSGDYERYLTIDGLRYSHIIDPRTGYPARGIKSVTIICPDAELADGLATSVFVLGTEKGLALVNQMKGFECIILNDADEFITSDGVSLNLIKNN